MSKEDAFGIDETKPIVVDHIVIRDADTKEEIVNQRSSMPVARENIDHDD